MRGVFGYLKKYMAHNYKEKRITLWNHNLFAPVSEEEIKEGEKKLGFLFPTQLREFYLNIGEGHLTTPAKPPAGYHFYSSNEILPPLVAATFYKPLEGDTQMLDDSPIEAGGGTHYMDVAMGYDLLEPGDLPFFEIHDSTQFMVLKPHSDNPNAVWYMGREKVEDSFQAFIWHLYYESPCYWEKKLC